MLKKISSGLKSIFGSKTVKKKEPVKEQKSGKAPKSANKGEPQVQENRQNKKRHSQHPPKKKPTHNKQESGNRGQQKNTNQNRQNRKPFIPERHYVKSDQWDGSEFKVPVVDGKIRFQDFEIKKEILHGVYDLGFEYCTDIQGETLPKSITGLDVTAQAQTGTGKTAAFLITIFNHILSNPIEKKRPNGTPRALILAPTRELVMQIEKDARDIGKYVDCRILTLMGGIDYGKQQNILKQEEIDVLICTPGRLIDFMKQRFVDLRKIEVLIIDEADRMLDMGFIPDVKKIVLSTPQKAKRQTMFFTATMNSDVRRLAESWTRQAIDISITPETKTNKSVKEITYITTLDEKPTLLYNIITKWNLERVLIFVNRKDEARRLRDKLDRYKINSVLLTGDVDQKKRINRLEKFRQGNVRVLVATDVASRGIHVDGISHVINYNMSSDVEDYVHRIGRTGRAGASGISVSFADEDDSHEIYKLEEYLGRKIECSYPEDDLLEEMPPLPPKLKNPTNDGREGQNRRKNNPRNNNRGGNRGKNNNTYQDRRKRNDSQNSGKENNN